jgi:hypothetical protein
VPAVRDAVREIPKVHHLFQRCISGSNFSLTRIERRTLLALAKPANWSTILENDATIHAVELEEREKRTLGNGIADLRTPTSIAVSGDGLSHRWFWRD